MSNLIWPSIAFYCLFGIFLFYQKLHAKNFRGGSEMFALMLSLSAFAGTVTGLIYLAFYGWNISWIAAAIVLGIGLAAGIVGLLLEKLTGPSAISMAGFIGWPLCAYFMFKTLPAGN